MTTISLSKSPKTDPIEISIEKKGMSLFYPQAGIPNPIWIATESEMKQIYIALKEHFKD